MSHSTRAAGKEPQLILLLFAAVGQSLPLIIVSHALSRKRHLLERRFKNQLTLLHALKMDERKFQAIIRELYDKREYRPTGVAVLQDMERRILFLKSAKSSGEWMFPQGGIESGETMKKNLERELLEETGIVLERDLECFKWAYLFNTLDAPSTRADMRGFTKGKAYFFTFARYVGGKKLILQKEEVAEARWLCSEDIDKYLDTGRKEKAGLCRMALKNAF